MRCSISILAALSAIVVGPLSAQGGASKAPASKAPAKQDSAARSAAGQQSSGQQQLKLSLDREVFSYNGAGRRDPMISLAATSDIRPLITEVQVIAIAFDEEGTNHTAVLKNIADKKNTIYRVRVGQMLGRMRVTQITRRDVVFTIDEIGVSRQERLSIKPDTTKRTP